MTALYWTYISSAVLYICSLCYFVGESPMILIGPTILCHTYAILCISCAIALSVPKDFILWIQKRNCSLSAQWVLVS